jgi:multidrug efflux pump subunit AcrA (membrane-fusion protein)
MKPLLSFTLLAVIGAAIALGTYRVVSTAPPKAVAKEEIEKGETEERSTSVLLSDSKIKAAGIEMETAGAGDIRPGLQVNGIVQPNQEKLVQVTPRFPGIVRDVRKRTGDVVQKGDLLATVESNQSLTVYNLTAPLAGTVIDRQVALGEYVSEQKPAFVVADLSTVWVDLPVYRRDLPRVHLADRMLLDVGDGGAAVEATISYLSPIGTAETQSALARAVVDNGDGRLRPGLFVSARLLLSEKKVPLAVKLSALQTIENRTVVFVRSGDRFEPHEVELGMKDAERAEVLFGLDPGDQYAAKNSFVIKAEMTKGAAESD